MRTITLLVCFIPVLAFGWGKTGHRAVCTIAYGELTPIAQAEVDRLIAQDDQYDTFDESCLFADGPPRIRTPDHFLNVPRSHRAISQKECPLAETCVLLAVDIDSAILADTKNADADRLVALKLLGHWVGDMHQPMHISYQDDLGANLIRQKNSANEDNLHSAWDSDMIAERLGDDHVQIATELRADISAADRLQWKFDSTVEWVNESYQITLSRGAEYCTQKQGACWYDKNNMILNPGEPQKEVNVSRRYAARHQKTVELRLKQAGIRLAAVLNAALGSN